MIEAISPIDGRYASKTAELVPYFSEFGLIRERVRVEIEYLKALAALGLPQIPAIDEQAIAFLDAIANNFGPEEGEQVKAIERTTNHDVKAVEYYIKDNLGSDRYSSLKEWVHFGLTSQDINNTANPILIKNAVDEVILPALLNLHNVLQNLAEEWSGVPMLAHTHGQPASPTTVGKEIRVFAERLEHQVQKLKALDHYGKFGGATGNFNAHIAAYPDVDWVAFGNTFLTTLGLRRIQTSTQIDHYDHLAELCHLMIRISNILIDFSRDTWTYISMEYFGQKTVAGEVGSSTMPHKVNPIDFENAEGNLGIAIALFDHLAVKLPVSRLQRDLTDSTVLRNTGVPFAHTLIAIKSLLKGIGKLKLNKAKLEADLDKNWAVVGEAIQTILRREGVANPYELLKELTRGNTQVTKASLHAFIDTLEVTDSVKAEMKHITPANYIGNAGSAE